MKQLVMVTKDYKHLKAGTIGSIIHWCNPKNTYINWQDGDNKWMGIFNVPREIVFEIGDIYE